MIVEIDPRLAEKSGEFTQMGFNIKAGAKAFQILTSTLYSDKNLAVLRELVCNAYDAQKENNTLHIPSEVHIPNYLEQWFRIRDYGKGIPHEFMMGEVVILDRNRNPQKVGYTTAFHSTRDDSNDAIGGFGIGRLAALSISDSYTAISITKGDGNKNTKRFYSIVMEGGLPNILLMGESEIEYNKDDKTTHTGFQVDVPVKNYSDFEQKAIKFLSNTDFKVNLTGTSREVENKEVVLERKTWRAFKTGYDKHTYRSYDDTVYAKVGIVRYPINSAYKTKGLRWISLLALLKLPQVGSLFPITKKRLILLNRGQKR
jgi:HSP90 family molecular chaperone